MSAAQQVKMNKFLVGALWLFLSLSTANAIWCYSCDKPLPTQPCPVGEEMCWAGQGAACFTSNVYIGNSMVRSEVGCIQGCQNSKTEHFFMWNEFICCYTEYCNK